MQSKTSTTRRLADATRPRNWSRDKPERHTVAQIAATIPPHQKFTRITGVLKTLQRIERLPDTPW